VVTNGNICIKYAYNNSNYEEYEINYDFNGIGKASIYSSYSLDGESKGSLNSSLETKVYFDYMQKLSVEEFENEIIDITETPSNISFEHYNSSINQSKFYSKIDGVYSSDDESDIRNIDYIMSIKASNYKSILPSNDEIIEIYKTNNEYIGKTKLGIKFKFYLNGFIKEAVDGDIKILATYKTSDEETEISIDEFINSLYEGVKYNYIQSDECSIYFNGDKTFKTNKSVDLEDFSYSYDSILNYLFAYSELDFAKAYKTSNGYKLVLTLSDGTDESKYVYETDMAGKITKYAYGDTLDSLNEYELTQSLELYSCVSYINQYKEDDEIYFYRTGEEIELKTFEDYYIISSTNEDYGTTFEFKGLGVDKTILESDTMTINEPSIDIDVIYAYYDAFKVTIYSRDETSVTYLKKNAKFIDDDGNYIFDIKDYTGYTVEGVYLDSGYETKIADQTITEPCSIYVKHYPLTYSRYKITGCYTGTVNELSALNVIKSTETSTLSATNLGCVYFRGKLNSSITKSDLNNILLTTIDANSQVMFELESYASVYVKGTYTQAQTESGGVRLFKKVSSSLASGTLYVYSDGKFTEYDKNSTTIYKEFYVLVSQAQEGESIGYRTSLSDAGQYYFDFQAQVSLDYIGINY
ncbi:MAG: hypothetical protein K6E20_00895, partial [Acholeplasmatales bacterium]|nr:hypothetical protein [Acholeplasmatales bacterium]